MSCRERERRKTSLHQLICAKQFKSIADHFSQHVEFEIKDLIMIMCRVYIRSNDFCQAIVMNEITSDDDMQRGEKSKRQRRGKKERQ